MDFTGLKELALNGYFYFNYSTLENMSKIKKADIIAQSGEQQREVLGLSYETDNGLDDTQENTTLINQISSELGDLIHGGSDCQGPQ